MAKLPRPVGASQSSQAKLSRKRAIKAPSAKLRDKASREVAWVRGASAAEDGFGGDDDNMLAS